MHDGERSNIRKNSQLKLTRPNNANINNYDTATQNQNSAPSNNNKEINLNNYNENNFNISNNKYNNNNNNNNVNNIRTLNVRGDVSMQNDIIQKKYMIEDLGEFRNDREAKKIIR